MGVALEVLTGSATNPGATLTALTPAPADSYTIRNAVQGSRIRLGSAWASEATPGILRVRSPRLHDDVQGFRWPVIANQPKPFPPLGQDQLLYSQDTLTVELSGGGAEVDIASLLVLYDDLAGASAAFMTPAEVMARIDQWVTLQVDVVSGGSAGQYSGTAALNSLFDVLKANRQYAVWGYLINAEVATIGLRGPATSNYRVGMPGTTDPNQTRNWFERLSEEFGTGLVPCINWADRAGTFIDVCDALTAQTYHVVLNLALLSA